MWRTSKAQKKGFGFCSECDVNLLDSVELKKDKLFTF